MQTMELTTRTQPTDTPPAQQAPARPEPVRQTSAQPQPDRTRAGSRRAAPVQALPLRKSYYPAVDGLRAIAILSVLVYHTGIYANGLFGVDIFFVLSGFLITLTLLREHHVRGTLHLGKFYLRRGKRLLPLLAVTLALTLWAVIEWGTRDELHRFAEQSVAALVYLTNWEQIAAGQSYWSGVEAIQPLGHLWSLAITEQFYVVWPVLLIIVMAVARRIGRSRGEYSWQWSFVTPILVLLLSLFGVVGAAYLSASMFDGTNADRVYLGTDTHFVGLVAGAAAAALCHMRTLQVSRAEFHGTRAPLPAPVRALRSLLITATSVAALGAIVVLSIRATSYEEPWLYSYGFTTVAVLGAILTLTLTSTENLLGKLLAWGPIVELGKVSYTLFLIHLPIFWIVQALAPQHNSWDILILGVPASILVASGLHHLVAEPIRLRNWKVQGKAVLASALVLVGVLSFAAPQIVMAAPRGTGEVRVLTLGDSLANDFASALTTNSGSLFEVVDGGFAGCGISGSTAQRTAHGIEQNAMRGCNPWQERWQELADGTQPDVIVANFAWDAVTQEIDGEWVDLSDSGFAAQYRATLVEFAELTAAYDAPVLVANSRLFNAVVTPEQAERFNGMLDDVIAGYPHLHLLDLQGQVCDATDCSPLTEDGAERYLDDRVHFSDVGKAELSTWLDTQILASVSAHHAEQR